MLAEECSSPYAAAEAGSGFMNGERFMQSHSMHAPRGGGFSFTAGMSDFTNPHGSNSEMAYPFSLGGVNGDEVAPRGNGDGNGVAIGAAAAAGAAGAAGREAREAALRGGSTHGVSGERALMLPRLVVVHPWDDEEENSMSSAGKKQRWGCTSMSFYFKRSLLPDAAVHPKH
jgi:hypothetical protein